MAEPKEIRPGVFVLRAYVGRGPNGSPQYLAETYRHPRADGGVREARKRLRALEARAEEEKEQRATDTFGALLDKWLDHSRRIGRSPNTIGGYERRVPVIKAALGSIGADALSVRHLDNWYADMLAAGRSPADIKAYARIVSAALNKGVKCEMVRTNVAQHAEVPHVPRHEIKPPPPERVATVINLARESKSPEMADLIHMYAVTGMRRGEMCALRWSCVDWAGQRIHVRRSIWQQGAGMGEKDTKTHADRWVPIGPETVAVLAARRERATAEAQAVGRSLNPDGYIWSTDPAGMVPYRPDRITQAFRRFCVQAETPTAKAAAEAGRELSEAERWPHRLHDLRHYAGTELVDAGLSLVAVRDLLGHRLTSTTADIYAHAKDTDAERITAVLGGSLSR